jgi:hypothetical protein
VLNARYLSPDVVKLLFWTILTGALYGGFFLFIDRIWGVFTSGTIYGGIAVVITALVFSFIHGSFASNLLDFVGLKALQKAGD